LRAADIVILNGVVSTMDPGNPTAEAVAITNGRIVAVDSTEHVVSLRGPNTAVVDAAGNSVVPGFIESHMHLFLGGAELAHLQLAGVSGETLLRDRVSSYARGMPDSSIVLAQGADYQMLSRDEPITRHILDRIVPDRPFAMTAFDHHTMWANTKALERAGILHGIQLPPGNEVVMGTDGIATGELREFEAMEPLYAAAGEGRVRLGLVTGGEPENSPTPQERDFDRATLLKGLEHCARHGITSFHNMDGNFYQLDLLSDLLSEGKLAVRARLPFHYRRQMPLVALEKACEMRERCQSDWITAGMVKIFMDGVIDTRTAGMLDDYEDMPGHRGQFFFDTTHFNEVATYADKLQLQIAVHATGDGAVRRVLDGYEAAIFANGRRDSRHRIEHVEVISETDIKRFHELGVIASMQPPHPPGTIGVPLEPTLSRIGPSRIPHFYAGKALQDAGARLAFGSDWPVASIDPIFGIHAAVTRRPWRAGDPEQKFSILEALHGYTAGGAFAEFNEHQKGKLKPGALGDLVVLSGNILSASPDTICEIHPLITICGGRITYQA